MEQHCVNPCWQYFRITIKGGNKMRTLLTLIGFAVLFSATTYGEAMQAVTEDGRTVRLDADGSWAYQLRSSEGKTILLYPNGTWTAQEPSASTAYTKPVAATTLVKGETLPYGIWVDASKWQMQRTAPGAVLERQFEHTAGEVHGAVIAERKRLTFDHVKNFVMASAKNKMADAALRQEETRLINGQNVLFLHIEGTYKSVPLVYLSYDYVGEPGTVQIYAWTSQALFHQYRQDMLDFLNGFVMAANMPQ
jgi:hypothetical protein